MFALEVNKVSKQFPGSKTVTLNNVSFAVNRGEIYGLLGPNGAGKTTLISTIAGLIAKDAGTITVFQHDIDKNAQKIKEIVNVVPGFTHNNSCLSLDEFLKEYALLYSVKNWKKRREDVIKLLELKDKRKTEMKDLSSGYKQCALLAKALMTEPKLLLMDEPTVGLDVEITIRIRGIIRDLKAKGHTIILTTHNMLEVEELCDRIGLLSQGKIIAEGTIVDIKKKIIEKNGIEIECENPRKILSMFKNEKYVMGTKVWGSGCIIYVKEYKFIKDIMKRLAVQKEKMYGLKIMEPTLEEAFIKLTGRKRR